MSIKMILGGVVLSALLVGQASAHHSGAMFAADKVVVLDGTVKEFQFTNPHSWIQLAVVDAKGAATEWSIELGSPNVLMRQGWKPTTIAAGQKVQISVHPLRDGGFGGSFIKATFADGRQLNTGSGSGGGAPSRDTDNRTLGGAPNRGG